MPPKKRGVSAPAEKELYLFLAEADQNLGINENHAHVITKLISDKIFSESADLVCFARFDHFGQYEFEEVTWDGLKKVNKKFSVPARGQLKGPDFVKSVLEVCETVGVNALEDTFTALKILVFANFTNYTLTADNVEAIKEKVTSESILLTFVFPTEVEEMDSNQKKNFELLKDPFFTESGNVFVHTYKSCLGRVLNIVANKDKRSVAWSVNLEIGSGIEIPIRKLIINRKETFTMKTRVPTKSSDTGEVTSLNRTEVVWTENDGTAIDQTEVGSAYPYGEKLVTIADEKTYETGDKCLKLLVFCPLENILPAYLIGDGTDIVFPQENNVHASLMFDALFKAMVNTKTVAVVRKVWRKNARVVLSVLSPDTERMGLILADLCFADDISVPHFPHLIKETSAEEDGITEKDAFIDELIKQKSIADFNPEFGPVDPKSRIFREHVTQKILNGEGKPRIQDNVDLYFKQISVTQDVIQRIQGEFPLAIKNEPSADRPSGKQIFRKRARADETEVEDKKLKLGDEAVEVKQEEEDEVEPEQDIDDMLEDL